MANTTAKPTETRTIPVQVINVLHLDDMQFMTRRNGPNFTGITITRGEKAKLEEICSRILRGEEMVLSLKCDWDNVMFRWIPDQVKVIIRISMDHHIFHNDFYEQIFNDLRGIPVETPTN